VRTPIPARRFASARKDARASTTSMKLDERSAACPEHPPTVTTVPVPFARAAPGRSPARQRVVEPPPSERPWLAQDGGHCVEYAMRAERVAGAGGSGHDDAMSSEPLIARRASRSAVSPSRSKRVSRRDSPPHRAARSSPQEPSSPCSSCPPRASRPADPPRAAHHRRHRRRARLRRSKARAIRELRTCPTYRSASESAEPCMASRRHPTTLLPSRHATSGQIPASPHHGTSPALSVRGTLITNHERTSLALPRARETL
jgi:hypothetical protein